MSGKKWWDSMDWGGWVGVEVVWHIGDGMHGLGQLACVGVG